MWKLVVDLENCAWKIYFSGDGGMNYTYIASKPEAFLIEKCQEITYEPQYQTFDVGCFRISREDAKEFVRTVLKKVR